MSISTGLPVPRRANETINLGEQRGRMRIASKEVDNITVSVSVHMLPRPRVFIEGRVAGSSFSILTDLKDHADADFTFHGNKAKTPIVIAHASEGDDFAFSAWPQKEVIDYGQRESVTSIQGAILNFYAAYEIGNSATRKILLEGETWAIGFTPQPDMVAIVDQLNKEGGYGVTHFFEIKRTNSEAITASSAADILEALKLFLSFARGANCGLGLVKGCSAANTPLWQQWGFSQTSRWSSTVNWFFSPQGQFLRGAFPGFMREWQNGGREHIRSAIEMYAEANRDEPDVKPSLMLAQSALELLSWLSMVRGSCLSADGFRALPAADHIRLLLHQCRIPSLIPHTLADLTRAAASQKLDGPGMLTEVRNALVHPGKSRKNMTANVYVEAWSLSMWYFELAILHRFGYDGSHVNRLLDPPALQQVPWHAS
ncbi:MAG: hypothetical protein ACR2I2_10855 [Bryobacteraceae bacterium]